MPTVFSFYFILSLLFLLFVLFLSILQNAISGTTAEISTYMVMWRTLLITSGFLIHVTAYIVTKT